MASIVNNLVFELSCFLLRSSCLVINFPDTEVLVSELLVVLVVDLLDPSVCTGCLDNDIVLTVVDQNWEIFLEQVFDSGDFGFHEIFIESLIDITSLFAIFNVIIKFVKLFDIWIPEIFFKEIG